MYCLEIDDISTKHPAVCDKIAAYLGQVEYHFVAQVVFSQLYADEGAVSRPHGIGWPSGRESPAHASADNGAPFTPFLTFTLRKRRS